MRTIVPALCAALCLLGCEPEICPNGTSGNQCELEVCGSMTITSRADIDNARSCSEINGNLMLLGGATEITASDFPNLSKISGDLVVTSEANREPRTQRLTLAALRSVGGKLQIANHSSLTSASFPALTTIGAPGGGGRLSVIFAVLRRLDLPALTTVNGPAELRSMSSLCSANVRRVTRVTGRLDLDALPNLPYSALSSLRGAAGDVSVTAVGCCYGIDSYACTEDWSSSCTTSACL